MALTMPNLESITYEWRGNAACREVEGELFFPVGTTGNAVRQISNAKAVCNTCDAKAECLEFALMTNQDSGVWGGKSEEERRAIRRLRAAAKKQAAAAASATAS